MKVLLKGVGGEGGGHTLEKMNSPPEKKILQWWKRRRKRKRGEGGLCLWFMTSKVSQKCSAFFFFVVRVSDPGVAGAEPRDAHNLTGHEIMLMSALTPPAPPQWSRGKSTKSTKLCSGPRTEAGRDTGGAAGR